MNSQRRAPSPRLRLVAADGTVLSMPRLLAGPGAEKLRHALQKYFRRRHGGPEPAA